MSPIQHTEVERASAPRVHYGGSRIVVDHTHCGRDITGLERITLELFSAEALAPLPVEIVRASGRLEMIMRQTFGLAGSAARDPSSIILCPGFPPSPLLSVFRARVLPYIHDLFLITRWGDLNLRAKLYMAAPFRLAVRRLPRFLVNSEYTRDELAAHARPDAEMVLYRPRVRNVFGLSPRVLNKKPEGPDNLRLVSLGTIEPRKNLDAAASILTALRAQGYPDATLEIIGRMGWGEGAERLRRVPGVILHGYQNPENVRTILGSADMLICTSHDEGLGLPLLEAQHGGIAVAAPDKRVFHEVLGESGLFFDTADPQNAASRIAAHLALPNWRTRFSALSRANLRRWNDVADRDRSRVIDLLAELMGHTDPGPC